jgi:hypothetical protein
MSIPVRAARHQESGTPDTEEGETTYRLLPDGATEVTDRLKSNEGTWRVWSVRIDEAIEYPDDAVGLRHGRA